MTRPPRRGRRRLVVGLIAAVAVVATAGTTLAVRASAPSAVLDGRAVSADELAFVESLPGTSGRGAALDRIAHDRAVFAIARRAGVAGDAPDLETLLSRRDTVNAARAEAAQAGEDVYGTVEYSRADYLGRVLAELRERTLTASPAALRVSDAAVAAELRAHPDAWSEGATVRRFTTLTVPWRVGGESGQAVLGRVPADGLAAAARRIPGARLGSAVLDPAAGAATGLSPSAEADLVALHPGDALDPQTRRGTWVRYRLDSETTDAARALAVHGPQIRRQLAERRYDALVTRTAAALRRTD